MRTHEAIASLSMNVHAPTTPRVPAIPAIPLILVPTRFELSAIKRYALNHALRAEFECVGVGPGAVLRWSRTSATAQASHSPAGRIVILAGLSGALDPSIKFATVRTARKIVCAGSDFERPSASFVPTLQSVETTTIAAVDEIITTAARKSALWRASGCEMVDMESGSFASLATLRQWDWGVLRVVSDDASSEVPEWICSVLHNDGSIDAGALFFACVQDPRRALTLLQIGRVLRKPLEALADELVRLLKRATAPPRTLVFGGTFDPPHRRHCEIVAEAAAMLQCDSINIVPAGESPLRSDQVCASVEDRLAMTRRAFASVPHATIDTRELTRPGKSFTVETLREIAAERRLTRENLVLLIGSDQAMQFDQWMAWREIDEKLATVAVVARPPCEPVQLARDLASKFAALGSDGERWKRAVLPIKAVELSASEVRTRLRAGQSIDDLVLPEVQEWIHQHGLYA